jgi:hypothetical protein
MLTSIENGASFSAEKEGSLQAGDGRFHERRQGGRSARVARRCCKTVLQLATWHATAPAATARPVRRSSRLVAISPHCTGALLLPVGGA